MGVTIQQWRCAIGKHGQILKMKKMAQVTNVADKVGDEGRQKFASIVMWIMIAILVPEVLKMLLVIGGVEMNPGPETVRKLNLYRLLRQIETSTDQMEFLRELNLLPTTMDCEHCCKTLTKIYPLNNADAKFKYFRCKCSNSEKIPVTKETFFYNSNITPKVFLVLAYGFCYR